MLESGKKRCRFFLKVKHHTETSFEKEQIMRRLGIVLSMSLLLAGCSLEPIDELTTENFNQVVWQSSQPVVVDFWAPW